MTKKSRSCVKLFKQEGKEIYGKTYRYNQPYYIPSFTVDNNHIVLCHLLMSTMNISVLPPVLVPRYNEYPTNAVPHGLAPFQQVQEPSMPYNVSFPHGFQQSPNNNQASPGSPYGVPGK